MILETAVNTTRQSRNRTQTSFNAEGAEQRGGEEHFLSPFSAFLSESLRLCVNCSPPASNSGYSSTRFFPDSAGKKRFAFGEQPFTGFASDGMFLSMSVSDEFSTYVADLLDGRYDCVDRIVLNGYFLMGQTSGGFLTWWNQLCPGAPLDQKKLEEMAGDFSRRLHAFAKKANIPVIHCLLGDKTKHQRAEKLLPKDPAFQGVFAILVARAPALVWKARRNREGKLVLRRQAPWPLVQHYHFHILDRVWGHLTIKMSGHPPFGVQVSLNVHEWVERQARHQSIRWVKAGNCFESGSDFEALDQLARGLRQPQGLGANTVHFSGTGHRLSWPVMLR